MKKSGWWGLSLALAGASVAVAADPHDPWGGANRYDSTFVESQATWSGIQAEYSSLDRPLPAGWGAAATQVFTDHCPNRQKPNCCENVWDGYCCERRCPPPLRKPSPTPPRQKGCNSCYGAAGGCDSCSQGGAISPISYTQGGPHAADATVQDGDDSISTTSDEAPSLPGMIGADDEASEGEVIPAEAEMEVEAPSLPNLIEESVESLLEEEDASDDVLSLPESFDEELPVPDFDEELDGAELDDKTANAGSPLFWQQADNRPRLLKRLFRLR